MKKYLVRIKRKILYLSRFFAQSSLSFILISQFGNFSISAAINGQLQPHQLIAKSEPAAVMQVANQRVNSLLNDLSWQADREGFFEQIARFADDTALLSDFSPRLIPAARKIITTTITAYSSASDETDDTPYITASGTWVRDGVIAANFLPLGTKVRLPMLYGNKIFTVEDRMHSRYDDRMDIWMTDKYLAKRFGIAKTVVEIL